MKYLIMVNYSPFGKITTKMREPQDLGSEISLCEKDELIIGSFRKRTILKYEGLLPGKKLSFSIRKKMLGIPVHKKDKDFERGEDISFNISNRTFTGYEVEDRRVMLRHQRNQDPSQNL